MKYERDQYYKMSKGNFTHEDESCKDEYIYYQWLENENEVLYVDMYNNLLIMEEENVS